MSKLIRGPHILEISPGDVFYIPSPVIFYTFNFVISITELNSRFDIAILSRDNSGCRFDDESFKSLNANFKFDKEVILLKGIHDCMSL